MARRDLPRVYPSNELTAAAPSKGRDLPRFEASERFDGSWVDEKVTFNDLFTPEWRKWRICLAGQSLEGDVIHPPFLYRERRYFLGCKLV